MYSKNYSKGVFLYLPWYRKRKSLIKQINFINSLPNVEHVEVWIEENLTISEVKFLKSLLNKYEIIIHAPWIHLSLISPHREIRKITVKLYLQTLKVADVLGAKLVTFHCGSTTIFTTKKQAAEIFIQNFKKIKNQYKGKAVFTIENVAGKRRGPQISYPNFPTDLMYLKKKLPWLNFTLDVGHAFEGGKNLDIISRFLKKYKNSVLNIHLQDAILKGEAHLALGKGNLDFNKFFQILNNIDYTGYISLETLSNEDTKKSWKKFLNYESLYFTCQTSY